MGAVVSLASQETQDQETAADAGKGTAISIPAGIDPAA